MKKFIIFYLLLINLFTCFAMQPLEEKPHQGVRISMSPEEKKEAEKSLFFPVDASPAFKGAAMIFENPTGVEKISGTSAFWKFVLSVHDSRFLKIKNHLEPDMKDQIEQDRQSFASSGVFPQENCMIAKMQSILPGSRTGVPKLTAFEASELNNFWVESFDPSTKSTCPSFSLPALTDYSKLMRAQSLYESMKNGLGQESDVCLLAEYLRFSKNQDALNELRGLFAVKKLPVAPFQSVKVIHETGDEIAPLTIQKLAALSLDEKTQSSVVEHLKSLLSSLDFLVNFQTLNEQDVEPHARAIRLILAVFHPFRDPFGCQGIGYSHCFKDSWPLLKSLYNRPRKKHPSFNTLHKKFVKSVNKKNAIDEKTKKYQKEKAFEDQAFHAAHSKQSNALDLEWRTALNNLLAVCREVDPQLKIFNLLSYNAVAQEFVKEGLSDQYDMERLKKYCFGTAVCEYTSQEVGRRSCSFRSPPSVPTLSTSKVFNPLSLNTNLFGVTKPPSAAAQPK